MLNPRIGLQRWAWAQRLLLAALNRDHHATALIIGEIGDCPLCWETVAHHVVGLAAHGWFEADDVDRAAVIDSLCNGITYTLDQMEGADP